MSPNESPAMVGHGVFRSEQLPSEAEQRRLHALRETRGLEVFAAIELERVEGGNGLLVFVPDGSLWVQGERHHVDALGRDHVRVVYEGKPLTPRFLIRAAQQSLPATLAEWEARQARRAEARARSLKELEQERERKRKAAEPVTAALYDGGLPPTLRGMVERLGLLGGKVEAVQGRVVVSLPPGEAGMGKLGARIAAELYRAEGELLATRKSNGPIAAAKVPDRPLLPSGRGAPVSAELFTRSERRRRAALDARLLRLGYGPRRRVPAGARPAGPDGRLYRTYSMAENGWRFR